MVWHDAFAHKGPVGEMDWDPEYKETPMVEQLGKVVDSIGNPRPIEHVYTDDGYQVGITGAEAQTILRSIQYVTTQNRLKYLKHLQSSNGLCRAINNIRGYRDED
jgi:hypothetical protein